ncbi:spore germination lipoprotein GerD [Ureibacillus sp. GCM10028918]|uniref:spore germination lipoprotein GerD n=1 Tax=Ureibacillus sp. GCM10028918 TaxID=3273429 RepID=UPI00360E0060
MINRILSLLFVVLVLASCSEPTNQALSYEEVKKIMMDSIQTEDGKKAIRQLLQDPSFRELIVFEHEEVQTAINTTLLSEESKDFWKKQFEDPSFQENIAKSMKEQQKEIMKELIKDPSYQEDLISFFGQAEMQKELETVLKSAPLRKQMEEVVTQTIENPLLQTKWQQLIKESGEGTSGGKSEESGGSSGGGEEESGGGSGSEGESGGGGA